MGHRAVSSCSSSELPTSITEQPTPPTSPYAAMIRPACCWSRIQSASLPRTAGSVSGRIGVAVTRNFMDPTPRKACLGAIPRPGDVQTAQPAVHSVHVSASTLSGHPAAGLCEDDSARLLEHPDYGM